MIVSYFLQSSDGCYLPSRLYLLNTPTASLHRGKPLNEYPDYDTKQSDGEASVMLEVWEIRSTPSLASLPGPLWPGELVSNRVQSFG